MSQATFTLQDLPIVEAAVAALEVLVPADGPERDDFNLVRSFVINARKHLAPAPAPIANDTPGPGVGPMPVPRED